MNRCKDCKFLNHGNECKRIGDAVSQQMYTDAGYPEFDIYDPEKFGCILWEGKDEEV